LRILVAKVAIGLGICYTAKLQHWGDGECTMSIDIPADFEPFVREQLQLGIFQSEQQIVSEALAMLKSERDETEEGIRMGLADAAAGRVQPVAEAFSDLRREFNSGESK
jgi:Arc/MetJ-type ribon-helix-helix transcriptional regulator